MRGARCSQCERPLLPHEQGTLCSPCLYGHICGTPEPPAQAATVIALQKRQEAA